MATPLHDPFTGFARDALRLRRTAETLQWRRVAAGSVVDVSDNAFADNGEDVRTE